MTTARINDVPLLGDTAVRWSLREGVLPVIDMFNARPDDLETLKGFSRRPVTLTVDGDGGAFSAENLYIIEFPSNDNPHIISVRLADRRWLWPYVHTIRRYNIRRRIGVVREKAGTNNIPAETQQVFPEVWYAQWSLFDPLGVPPAAKWNARQVLDDVLRDVSRAEIQYSGRAPTVIIQPDIPAQLPIEDLQIDDSGENAVRHVLDYLPGTGITVELNGDVTIYSKVSGAEDAQVDRLGTTIQGEGSISLVSNNITRPKEVHVLFQREVEVRFDFKEITKATTITASPQSREDSRFMENVLAVPDFNLKKVTDRQFRKVQTFDATQGTWISIDSALQAWSLAENGTYPTNGAFAINSVVIDHEFIQQAMVPFMDLWAGVGLLGQAIPDADWMGRIAAIKQHYRRTYRLNQRWLDRILSLRAYRVATVDPASGSRAKAPAYSDYTVVGSMRSFAATDGAMFLAMSVDQGIDPDEPIIKTTKQAPADVSVVDSDQGILRVNYLVDPFKVYDSVLPGAMIRGRIPDGDVNIDKQVSRGATNVFNGYSNQGGPDTIPALAPNHRLAVIITAVPASPNSVRASNQLHRIIVNPGDLSDVIPPRLQAGLNRSNGPVMEIKVSPGVEVARTRWIDSRRVDIERIFGVKPGVPNLDNLVVNEEAGGANIGASLNSIAKAVAARVYASLSDRQEGTAAGGMSAEIKPRGWANEVSFNLETTGEKTTQISLPEKVKELNLFAFLDDASRKVIMRMPQPPAGQ